MQQIRNGYHGARVLLHVNADFLLFVATLGAALLAAAYIGTL
ncbi:hypothetical protein rosmuc_01535 [Roseovarius mucosus DSM 17069]|uniref:Uncharacterized protein n=1 Tax=Roseovarius mucosus DSM 17069 TaxID=1288298 RepID=A0A0A0HRH5_9RHOB|nr:hypothetical protein [Roseovarius mucosus]KGM88698.1 hypothetical protein rosmuc_01535 [Roseovarius mucosus DSM 17069]